MPYEIYQIRQSFRDYSPCFTILILTLETLCSIRTCRKLEFMIQNWQLFPRKAIGARAWEKYSLIDLSLPNAGNGFPMGLLQTGGLCASL